MDHPKRHLFLTPEEIASKALPCRWEDTEAAARAVARWCSTNMLLHEASAENASPPPKWKMFFTEEETALEGPYECPNCSGHVMLDATFLDQVHSVVTCPYCEERVHAPDGPSS